MQDTKQDNSADTKDVKSAKAAQATKDGKKDKDPKKPVSMVTYALGYSAKISWILILSTTALLTTALMTLTKPNGKDLRDREKMIDRLRLPVKWFEQLGNKLSKESGGKFEGLATVVTASFIFAHFLKRIVEIPALHRGKKKADEINQQFATLQDENNRLLNQLAQYEGTPQVTHEATPQTAAPKPPAPPTPAAVTPSLIPTQRSPAIGLPAAIPPGYKMAETHAGSIQDGKNIPPLIGTGV